MATFFHVPAGTSSATCRSCQATIYWILTAASKRMPVDCAIEGGAPPTATSGGQGLSHFATCPQASEHRKPR